MKVKGQNIFDGSAEKALNLLNINILPPPSQFADLQHFKHIFTARWLVRGLLVCHQINNTL